MGYHAAVGKLPEDRTGQLLQGCPVIFTAKNGQSVGELQGNVP